MASGDVRGGCTEFGQLEVMLIQRALEKDQHAIMYFSSAPRKICVNTQIVSESLCMSLVLVWAC